MSRIALVVGINTYESDQLPNLGEPATDAEAIAQMLETQGGFKVWRLPEIIESTSEQKKPRVGKKGKVAKKALREKIAQLFKPDGMHIPEIALLYFSGHGLQDPLGTAKGHLATSNADPAEDEYGVSFQWIRETLEASPVRTQVVWLDCCYAGGLLFDEVKPAKVPGAAANHRFIIAACRDAEPAFPDLESNHSVFTKALLEGLDPTCSPNGQITDSDLKSFTTSKLQGQLQTPLFESSGEPIVLTYLDTPHPKRNYLEPVPKPRVPRQMPPLPHYFVPRPEQEAKLKQVLLNQEGMPGTLVVSAIYGLGGIGKSVLAAALAHDQEIQQHFVDGTLWVTLGQQPDLLPLLGDWIQSLGDRDFKPTTLEAASAHLRTLLYDKQMLLVVDDVWQPDDAEWFRVGGTHCCVLITTREARVPGAQRYELDAMSPEEALKLITGKLLEPLGEAELDLARAFAKRVGYLPLALELAAAQIEEGMTWAELLEEFQSEVGRLECLDVYRDEDLPDETKRRRYSLMASFNLSLRQLSPEQLRQFAWLGILPEDVQIGQVVASMLWQVTPRQAGAILRQFRSKALLVTGVQQEDRATYRLHDLMHDRAQQLLQQSPHPSQVGELPGLGMTKAEAHAAFIERYRAKTQGGMWHTLPDDGYIYTHLTWHLEQAKAFDAIHSLLQEETSEGRNGWYIACEANAKLPIFVSDVARAWRLADEMDDQPSRALALQWRYALIQTSLNSLIQNIPPELIAALVREGVWNPAQGLAYAQQAQQASQRANAVALLASYLPNTLLKEALEVTRQIQDESARARALSSLAEHLPELWDEALEVTRQIQSEFDRASALSSLAEHLPQELMSEALEVTRQIQDESARASALSSLAEHLPQELMSEALEVTRQIQDESARARALSSLAEHLPKELMSEALEVTCQIQSESDRASTLSSLAAHLPKALMSEALEVTRRIQSESDRASALRSLAAHFPELWDEALEATRQIQSEPARAWALSGLAVHFPELWDEALEATRQIQSEPARAWALSSLAAHFPELWDEALEVTRQIQGESARVNALRSLAAHLPKALMSEALEVTRQIQDEPARAWALSSLAAHLPKELMSEALEVTRQIQGESARALALSSLAAHLPKELMSEALEVTRQIQDESVRALALSSLAAHFPELWGEALEVTRQIQGESARALALSSLAVHFPELWDEALEVTRQIQSKSPRAWVLSSLAAHFPELWGEALEVTRQIQDESDRAWALSSLAVHFPELWDEALEVTRQIQSEPTRVNALRSLAVHFPELWDEALEVTRQIQNESARASALSSLAVHFPELWDEALEVTRQIQDESARASPLSSLAVHFPELWDEALEVTRQIQNESARAWALSSLAAHLPKELMSEALEVTRQIQSEPARAWALKSLAEHLPKQLLFQWISITQEIKDPYHCANAWCSSTDRLEELDVNKMFWNRLLHILAYRDRKEFLTCLPAMRTTILRLAGEPGLNGVLQSMRDVSRQWP